MQQTLQLSLIAAAAAQPQVPLCTLPAPPPPQRSPASFDWGFKYVLLMTPPFLHKLMCREGLSCSLDAKNIKRQLNK